MDDLYRELIIDRYQNPLYRGVLEPNDITFEDSNPLCGDEIRIDLRVGENGNVTEAVFSGHGCAISQASADLLIESILGKSCGRRTEAGIPAILTEAGGQGIWKQADVDLHVTGLNRLMRHLNMIDGPAPESLPTEVLENFIWMRSEHEGFYYPQVPVGDAVKAGQALGRVTDYEGRVLQPVVAPADGCVLFLVSSLAINQGDPWLAIGA